MAKTLMKLADASGVKAQNESWLSTDLYFDKGAGKSRISVSVNTNAIIQVTIDGATTWINLNEAKPLIANCFYGFDVYLRTGDNFNIRTPDVTGTTVHFCRMDLVDTEG